MKRHAASSVNRSSPYPNPGAGHLFNTNPNCKRFRSRDGDDELAVADYDTASFAPRSRFESDYVTFELGGFSRMEIGELKRRLVSELEQVRIIRSRIESCSALTGNDVVQHLPTQFLATDVAAESARFEVAPILPKGRKGPSGVKRPSTFHGLKGNKDGSDLKKLKEHNLPPEIASGSMMKSCGQILTKLMKHKHSWVFKKPVDALALGLHDYHQIIKNPMDLGTVKKNLERNVYASPGDFAAAVRLTFDNALTYNPKGHEVYAMAEVLLSMFEQLYDPVYQKYRKEVEKSTVGGRVDVDSRGWEDDLVQESGRREAIAMPKTKKPSSRPVMNPNPSPKLNPGQEVLNREGFLVSEQTASLKKSQVPGGVKQAKVGKLQKPKAKDPIKRDMSFQEKAELGMNLQNLPPDKMGQLLDIIKKGNKQFKREGDEIELDIEALSTETLWELDRFVCNYKKLFSKNKLQGLIQNQASASEIIDKSPENGAPNIVNTQHNQKRLADGDEDINIGVDIPMGSHPRVETRMGDAKSNASSSSSSGRNSSSASDSDSRSSSGSDSNAGSMQSPFTGSKGAPGSLNRG